MLYGACSRLYIPKAAQCHALPTCITHMALIHRAKTTYMQTLRITTSLQKYDQGRIEPPKAARGHATSDSAHTDGIVLSVTKNRNPLRM